jgi:hypothetical protein
LRVPIAAILLSVSATALIACGDDAERVTAPELISKGDAICAEGIERFAEIQAEPPANPNEAADQTNALVDAATDELNDLRNLRPPEELADKYESYLQARGRALELLEEGRDAAEDRDAEAYAAAQTEVTADQGERLKLAQAVGFKTCSKP